MGSNTDHIKILDDRAVPWLNKRGFNQYSQFGEDGLIQAIFEKIGITNRWCLEVGAADGQFFSNTKLLRDDGWSAVLIESDDKLYDSLIKGHKPNEYCYHAKVERTGTSLDFILGLEDIPEEFDLASIDVDGADYWLWESLKNYRPRVVVIEFGYYNPELHIPGEVPNGMADGAGIEAIKLLGVSKGYELVAKTYCNLIFIRSDLMDV